MVADKDSMSVRRRYLHQIVLRLEKSIKKAPEGKLRINNNKGRVEYYNRTLSEKCNGIYITKGNIDFIRRLAQKDYELSVLKVAKQELKAIEKFEKYLPKHRVEDIYCNLKYEKQKLVIPIIQTDEQFLEEWKLLEYEGLGFVEGVPELYTSRNERMRSKSEIMIADALAQEKIPYRYECPLELDGYGTVYPDFTVLNMAERKEVYWEHFGLMDDLEYVGKAIKKIAAYKRNGIFPGDKLILTYEMQKYPLDKLSVIQEIKQHFL